MAKYNIKLGIICVLYKNSIVIGLTIAALASYIIVGIFFFRNSW